MLTTFAKIAFAAAAATCLLSRPALADWTVKVAPNTNQFGLGVPVIEVEIRRRNRTKSGADRTRSSSMSRWTYSAPVTASTRSTSRFPMPTFAHHVASSAMPS